MSSLGREAIKRAEAPFTDAERLSDEHDVVAAIAGSVTAVVLALLFLPVREVFGAANEGMLLLLVVMAAATRGGRHAGVVTSVAAATAFTATQATSGIEWRDSLTLVLMIAVGVIVGSYTRRARVAHAHAVALRRSLEIAYDTTGLVAAGATAVEVAQWALGPLQEILRDGTRVDPGSLMSAHAPGGFVHIEVLDHVSHLWAPDRPQGSWSPGLLNRFDDGGEGRLEIPIAFCGERLGRIILDPGPDRFLSSNAHDRVALIAAQVAIAASFPSSR